MEMPRKHQVASQKFISAHWRRKFSDRVVPCVYFLLGNVDPEFSSLKND
jgi:hypothetical protein